jgi:hypothetical protein
MELRDQHLVANVDEPEPEVARELGFLRFALSVLGERLDIDTGRDDLLHGRLPRGLVMRTVGSIN